MGNRSFLYFNREDDIIFEANNSLPFFWLGLLDRNILDHHRSAWKKYDELAGNDDQMDEFLNIIPSPLDFKINKAQFERNASRTLTFLKKNFPGSLPLFDDFRQFVESGFRQNDSIFLDVLEISGFYTSVDEFLESIYADIKAIDEDDPGSVMYLFEYDLIASGTGFAVSNEFPETSTAYREAMKNRRPPVVKQEKNRGTREFNSFALLVYIAVFLLCPLFTYLTYKGFRREGISFFVLFIGISNIGFYWFSIHEIIAEIKASRKGKNN